MHFLAIKKTSKQSKLQLIVQTAAANCRPSLHIFWLHCNRSAFIRSIHPCLCVSFYLFFVRWTRGHVADAIAAPPSLVCNSRSQITCAHTAKRVRARVRTHWKATAKLTFQSGFFFSRCVWLRPAMDCRIQLMVKHWSKRVRTLLAPAFIAIFSVHFSSVQIRSAAPCVEIIEFFRKPLEIKDPKINIQKKKKTEREKFQRHLYLWNILEWNTEQVEK